MPLYEYQCSKCAHRFERIQKFSDPPIADCPQCGGPVEQLLSAPAVQFKGSGWYVTDYARQGAKSSGNGKGKESGESKPEVKSPSDSSTSSSSESKGEKK